MVIKTSAKLKRSSYWPSVPPGQHEDLFSLPPTRLSAPLGTLCFLVINFIDVHAT